MVDLAGKFQQKRKFVEIAEAEVIGFYEDVCQHLSNWVAPAPKVKKATIKDQELGDSTVEEIRIPADED